MNSWCHYRCMAGSCALVLECLSDGRAEARRKVNLAPRGRGLHHLWWPARAMSTSVEEAFSEGWMDGLKPVRHVNGTSGLARGPFFGAAIR